MRSKLMALWTGRYEVVYFFGLYLAYVVFIFCGTSVSDQGHSFHPIFRVIAPAIELGAALCMVRYLMSFQRSGHAARIVRTLASVFVAFVVGMIYASQMFSLHLSDNFISILALENGAEGRFVRGYALYLTLFVAGIWWSIFCFGAVRELRGAYHRRRWRFGAFALLAFIIAQGCLINVQAGGGRMEAEYRQAPESSFAYNYFQVLKARGRYGAGRSAGAELDLASLGVNAYPFERHAIYNDPLPFASVPGVAGPPNVIVIFTEGLSSRLIGSYGGAYPGLTPNIDKLAGKSMRVDNYFNHTAATYRGLQGQLVSGYPEAGGAGDRISWESEADTRHLVKTHYQSIPLLLRDAGYRSYFFSPHPDVIPLNTLLRSMGFDRVFSLDKPAKASAAYNDNLIFGSLNDFSLFDEMRVFLAGHLEEGDKKPMFIGAYNVGTHAFMDTQDGGISYGDGSNPVLNRIHNYDAALGRFLDYFYSSPYARNTILIFTTDHAMYPEPAYRSVAGEHFKAYFVDRIPLLIYDPVNALPSRYDADGRTSVDLAPTIMQLLGIQKGANSFLGATLFEPEASPFGFAAIGNDLFVTDHVGVFAEAELPLGYRQEFERRKKVVMMYYRLEGENRIFTPEN